MVCIVLLLTSCAGSMSESVRSDHSIDSYTYYILAVEAEQEYSWGEALKQMNLALKDDPESSYLKTEISQLYLRMNRLDDAVKIAEEVIQQDPGYEPALSLLARLYSSQKDFQKAINMYSEVIKNESPSGWNTAWRAKTVPVHTPGPPEPPLQQSSPRPPACSALNITD